jgi:lipopolysaccharide export LptBFGC system permease protein LptF
MIFILHRYIFREVFRVFTLATVALTIILSLGMILRPVQEFGVGPQQVFHLIGYFLPITLTFVLPMAALFATSLVYGRFAGDNELDACRASGVGLPTLVYPGLALALMIAIANLVLSFYVTPAFVQRAERALKTDAQKIIFRNIQRKGYYSSPDGRWQIYADQVDSKNKILSGVVITEVKYSGITKIITSEDALVQFNSQKRFNDVQISALNTYQIANNNVFYNERLSISRELPPLLGDDIKFKKIDKIKQIQADNMLFNPIAKLAFDTYAQLTTELIAQQIAEQIKNPEDRFYMLFSGEKVIRLTAGQCSAGQEKEINLAGNVTVEEYDLTDPYKLVRTLTCSKAQINIEGDEDVLALTLALFSPKWRQPDKTEGIAGHITFRGLVVPDSVTKMTDRYQSKDILKTVSPSSIQQILTKEPSKELEALLQRLKKKIKSTAAQIKGEIHSRLAFGMGCVPLIMIGIGLGIIKKGGHLLSAFGASSIPAAVLIVCIICGKNIIENLGSQLNVGVGLIWAGPAVLLILAVAIYRFLLKK